MWLARTVKRASSVGYVPEPEREAGPVPTQESRSQRGWARECVSAWTAEDGPEAERLHLVSGLGRRRTRVIVLTRRLLVALVSAAALGGCAPALVTNDDARSKEAPAPPPASTSPSNFGSSAPHWFGSGGP